MAVIDLLDLPDALPPRSAIAGLDLGEKTIGVAISDVSLVVATPAQTLKRVKFTRDAESLFALMAGRGAAAIIIGLPVNMDGTEGPSSQSARAFARNLLRLRDLPIAFWDERLSTVAVSRTLIGEADLSRSKRAAAVDKLAAAWILQGALDRLRAAKRDPTTAL